MDLETVRTFVGVADVGRFREAGAELSLTQQAVTGTEWAAFYDELALAFGLIMDATGPNFGLEPLLDMIADSPALAAFVGEGTRFVWPADYDLRRRTPPRQLGATTP